MNYHHDERLFAFIKSGADFYTVGAGTRRRRTMPQRIGAAWHALRNPEYVDRVMLEFPAPANSEANVSLITRDGKTYLEYITVKQVDTQPQ